MSPADIAAQCVQQINLVGDDAKIMLNMKGRCNAKMQKRLCPGGPIGHINGEDMTDPERRVVVCFGAMDVLAFLAAKGLIEAVGPDGKSIV
jgi:hypothetical protein